MRVLVLDANQRAALAVVRSLGRRGLEVVAADCTSSTLAGASRFALESLVYPDFEVNPDAFLQWLSETIATARIDIILPVTEISTDLVVRNHSRWPSAHVPFADIATIDRVSDKVQLYELAQELGVPTPRSVVIRSQIDLEKAVSSIGFPCILKPHRSRVYEGGRWLGTAVRRADNEAALGALLTGDPGLKHRPILYQEFIPGKGAGVFACYRHGAPRAWFAHRRLREKPPAGGVSVLSESAAPPPELVAASRRLLDAAGWHGVAMVEYRVAPDGNAYLMEVNARFWGSLQLAIDAGVDFPSLLLEPLTPQLAPAGDQVQTGVRLRWLLGDLDRLWLVFKGRHRVGWSQALRELGTFLLPDITGRTRQEIFRWSDPRPAWVELKRYIRRTS